jgi:hypothetical protein
MIGALNVVFEPLLVSLLNSTAMKRKLSPLDVLKTKAMTE